MIPAPGFDHTFYLGTFSRSSLRLLLSSDGNRKILCHDRKSALRFWSRLVGLVVKASASRAEDPGLESRLRRDFFGVGSYQ